MVGSSMIIRKELPLAPYWDRRSLLMYRKECALLDMDRLLTWIRPTAFNRDMTLGTTSLLSMKFVKFRILWKKNGIWRQIVRTKLTWSRDASLISIVGGRPWLILDRRRTIVRALTSGSLLYVKFLIRILLHVPSSRRTSILMVRYSRKKDRSWRNTPSNGHLLCLITLVIRLASRWERWSLNILS